MCVCIHIYTHIYMCVCVCVYIYDGHATALLNSRHSINDYDYPTEFSPGPLIYFLGFLSCPHHHTPSKCRYLKLVLIWLSEFSGQWSQWSQRHSALVHESLGGGTTVQNQEKNSCCHRTHPCHATENSLACFIPLF